MTYESPIHVYTTEIRQKIGEECDRIVFEEIKKVGVEVDKDELIKALNYDRDQYEKGYRDGRRDSPRERMAMKILDGLDGLLWYNGLTEVVFSWMFLPIDEDAGIISCPDDYNSSSKEGGDYWQLQALWVIAVEAFGCCGTSPRYGWIEDVESFKSWILEITKTWRGSEDYNGPEEYRVEG